MDPLLAPHLLPPHLFVRGLTAGLAVFWSLRALVRGVRSVRVLNSLAERSGFSRGVVLRAAWKVLLRSTVLDPTNVFLGLLLLAIVWVGEQL